MKTWPHKKWNPFVHLDFHTGIFLTGPIPVPGAAWHIGFGALALPWIYMGSQKYNECKLFADGFEVVSRGHEPKYLILPHWNLFPFTPAQPNLLIPILLLSSANKCQFAVSSVRAKDGPVAVSLFRVVGINQACNEHCSAPTSLCFNWSSVDVGFTWGDLVASLLCFAFDSLKSFIEGKIFGKLFGKLPRGLFKGQMKGLLGLLGLPKVFRGAGGKFASLAEEQVAEGLDALGSVIYGELLGGGTTGTALGLGPIDLVDKGSNFVGLQAEKLGAWIDGRSERFAP